MEKKKRNGVSSVLPEKSIAVEGRKGLAMPMNKVSGSKKNLRCAPVPSCTG